MNGTDYGMRESYINSYNIDIFDIDNVNNTCTFNITPTGDFAIWFNPLSLIINW